MTQKTDKSQIIITHYINPSMFWFKNQCSDSMQFLSYETELQSFAKLTAAKSIFSEGHQPVCGEIVLVKKLYEGKWVRCKVENITEFSDGPEYTVWLIDYGQPLRTNARWILPLHKDLALVEIPLIYKAGLANIVPAAKVFNLETAESEYIKTEHWSEYAVTTVEKILTENDIVSFAAEFKINNHYFGNVEVLTYRNKTIQLRNVILSLNYGRLTKNLQEFSQDLKNGRTNNFERFESQVRQSTFSVKKNQISHSLEIQISNELATVPTIDTYPKNPYTQKVTEWNERNIRDSVINSNIRDCPPVPENAVRSRPTLHYTPGDDVESNIMACAGSKEHRKMLEKNKINVVKTQTTISDFLARLDAREESENIPAKPPKREPVMIPAGFSLDQIHTVLKPNRRDDQKRNFDRNSAKQCNRSANQSRVSQASNTTSSSGDFEEVNWNQSQKSVHRASMEQTVKELHIRDSTSEPSSISDESEQRSSCSSRTPRRSALSLARKTAKAMQQ